MASHYRYLNKAPLHRLVSQLSEAVKTLQPKAPASQWLASIRALTQKGVKGFEIEDSGVEAWLEARGKTSTTREEILRFLDDERPTIKEIDLSRPMFSGYKQPGECRYQETLYNLNTNLDNMKDRLDEIRFELEELDFNPELLLKDPGIVLRLDAERKKILSHPINEKKHYITHFQNIVDPTTGQPIQRLMGHARTSIRGDLFFVEEIQSDWAQKGRRNQWTSIQKAPFITNTEAWSGLLLRRQMQRAAENPEIKRFAWITGQMRNGWGNAATNGVDAEQAAEQGGLNDFYLKILPKIADKVLKGTGEKVRFLPVTFLPGGPESQLPGFELTDKVRERLLQALPLYSADALLEVDGMSQRVAPEAIDPTLTRALSDAKEMLDNTASIRLAAQVIQAASGQAMAGRQVGRMIEVSRQATNPDRVLWHEVWHYAHTHLISPRDAMAIERAFEDGSPLNQNVRMAMVRAGMPGEAVEQCDDAREAAAHAFSLWKSGEFDFHALPGERAVAHEVQPVPHVVARTVYGIVEKVDKALAGLSRWVDRLLGSAQMQEDARVAELVFEALDAGQYGLKAKDEQADALEQQGVYYAPKTWQEMPRARG